MLCGSTPHTADVKSWRPEAIEILDKLGFNGTVLVPEFRYWPSGKTPPFNFLAQVEWEWQALNSVDLIAFWIPRDLKTLPGFTTNVEFGRYVKNCIYGRPDNSEKNDYLDWFYEKVTKRKPLNSLYALMAVADEELEDLMK